MVFPYIPYIRSKVGHDPIMAVGVGVLVIDEQNRILVEKRSDNGLYCLPGGALDYGEKILDGAKRELYEETGVEVDNLVLLSLRSGPSSELHYPNGDVTSYTNIDFYARVDSRKITLKTKDEESTWLGFLFKDELPKEDEWLPGTYATIQKFLDDDFSVEVD